MLEILFGLAVLGAAFVFISLKIIRPSERGLVERFGKYHAYKEPGLVILIPFIDKLVTVDITEDMVDAAKQEVITKDSLNAQVDAQIYFKIMEDEASVKKSQYAVSDYYLQITALARTTLRAIIGGLSLTEANQDRNKINFELAHQLGSQTKAWGIQVVRAELKEIQPPEEVQAVMNKVVVAEKEKTAAIDFATSKETQADGEKRATIKSAEADKQQKILRAQGDAEARIRVAEAEAKAIEVTAKANAERIKLVNESAQKYFKGEAVELRRLEAAEKVLENSTKLIVPQGSNLINLVGDAVGSQIIPYDMGKNRKK